MIKRYRLIIGWAVLTGFALAFVGCAKVSLSTQCPASSTGVSFALQGSTVGNQLLSMLSSGLATGGLIAGARLGAQAPTTTATMSYEYVPIFGSDSGSLTCVSPPTTTTVVTSPPASIVH